MTIPFFAYERADELANLALDNRQPEGTAGAAEYRIALAEYISSNPGVHPLAFDLIKALAQKVYGTGLAGEALEPGYVEQTITAALQPTGPASKGDGCVGELVAEAAARFCAELQEDGEGVPKAELAALHEALNEWEGLGPRRSMFDDRTPQTSALADLEVIERDPHATDRQRRIAARAVVAFSQYAAIPDLLQAVEELLFGDDRQSEAGELKALLKVRVAYERAREGDPK